LRRPAEADDFAAGDAVAEVDPAWSNPGPCLTTSTVAVCGEQPVVAVPTLRPSFARYSFLSRNKARQEGIGAKAGDLQENHPFEAPRWMRYRGGTAGVAQW
jgi:hypothetical protein